MPSQPPMLAADLAEIAERGRALILSLQDAGGAYPASPSFSAYRGYSWLRDGAFIADAMSAAGEARSASLFFGWCSRTLVARAPDIHRVVVAARSGAPVPDAEMLPTRFTLDGGAGDAEWWDFQLDGYGLWLWAALTHVERHDLDASPWRRALELTVDYLVSSWDRPCYDWWEEHIEEVHVSTLGSIEAGLRAAAGSGVLDAKRRQAAAGAADAAARLVRERGTVDGHLVKWLGSTAVDASLAALIAPLHTVPGDSALGRATLAELERQLVVDGGTHRFTTDTYYGGGQWPLLSCFMGLAQLASGDAVRARELLDWAAGTVRESGTMPEQVADHLIDPTFVAEWVQRWGASADPLLWSHAMFLRLAVELGVVGR
jgi:GH15 family glucan-1,4-alpha-glucosidase